MATDVRHIAPITGLRFPAAVAVAVAHSPHLAVHADLPAWGQKLLHLGHVSVPFFFCMSAFVLTLTYSRRLPLFDRPAFGRFFAARAARIWPLHLLVLAVALAFPFQQNPLAGWQHALEALLVHFWIPHTPTRMGANGVCWTLSVELLFYLTLPLWFALARRGDGRPPAFWLAVAGLIAVGQVGTVLACEAWLPPLATGWLCLTPPIHFGEFGVGITLAKAWTGLHDRGWCGRPPRRVGRTVATLGEVGVLMVLVVTVLFHGKASYFLNLCGAYYTPVAGAVLLVFALQRGRLSGWCGRRWLTFLGETSFAFYLVHCLVIFHLSHALGGRVGPWPLTGLTLAGTTLLAATLYVGFESPTRRWLLNRFKRPYPPVVVAPQKMVSDKSRQGKILSDG